VGVCVGTGAGCAGDELPPQEESAANEITASAAIKPFLNMCLSLEVVVTIIYSTMR
jgi:hypothetical protein